MFLPPAEIKKVLESAVGPEEMAKIIRGERTVTTSCGSGMTAGVLWLGLQLLGVPNVGLYDEVSGMSSGAQASACSRYFLAMSKSWTGYAMRPTSDIQKSL